jgi:hypothetical protein
MIGTIRKHQKWLWIFVISITIVTFVGFLSPNSRYSGGGNEYDRRDHGTINGKPITALEYAEAEMEECISLYLSTRGEVWPKNDDSLRRMGYDLEEATYQRLLLNAKVRENKIYVNNSAVAAAIKQSIFGLDPSKALPVEEYHKILASLAQKGASIEDFHRFIRNRVAHQQLIATYGISGALLGPNEAETLYRRENQPIVAQIVRFNYTNYMAQVAKTPKDIEAYFTNNQADYRLQERVDVNYVKFDTTNFFADADKILGSVSNLTEIINKTYASKGPDAFKDASGKPLSADEAKAKLRNDYRKELAIKAAHRKANDFLNELFKKYSDSNPYSVEAFAEVAKTNGFTVHSTGAFDMYTGPANLKVSRDFAQQAFRLGEDPSDKSKKSLFSTTPIVTEDAVYAISLLKRIPSQARTLEQARTEVEANYVREKAFGLASVAAQHFESILTNGVAAGKTFEAICAEAKVTPETLPVFSLATRAPETGDKNEFEQIQGIASRLSNGKASPLAPARYGGFILYVKDRQPVDDAKMKSEMPLFAARMRDQRQSRAFQEWFIQQSMDLRRPAPPAAAKSKS